MRTTLKLALGALALAVALPAAAQTAPDKTYASSAEIAAVLAKAKAAATPGGPTTGGPLLTLAPYRASLEYRTGKANGAVHENEAEFFYVLEGSGTWMLGGHLKDPKRTNEHNLSGEIEGGEARKVAKGDVLFVPQNTPHQVVQVDGALVLISMHVPRP